MEILQWLFIAGIITALLSSVFFSLRARRSKDQRLRGLYAARMNISMGIMLILMAGIQMIMFTGDTVRVIVGTLFLLLGLFNFFAGLRNHRHFSTLKS
ncbi:YtpI family protein [Paenibacillus sp. 1P07SE]|uniref:YtpI family protein n=1 Tax=Paenibacillus sp. 1P07SE TaxID=3132209 RepID=UPI0039A41A8A